VIFGAPGLRSCVPAAAIVVALAGSAGAGERVNQEQVAACLDGAAAWAKSAETCLGVALNPCRRMVARNAARACFHRLRVRWRAEIRGLGRRGEGALARLDEARRVDRRTPGPCGGETFAAAAGKALGAPLDPWTADNACLVFRAALAWHGLAQGG